MIKYNAGLLSEQKRMMCIIISRDEVIQRILGDSFFYF